MSMMSEFKEFALKGNVMDLAVGVIIGGAFGKNHDVVGRRYYYADYLCDYGRQNRLYQYVRGVRWCTCRHRYDVWCTEKAGVPVFAYGNFVTILINFIILAFIIFMLVKAMNRLRRQSEAQEAAAPEPSEEVCEISSKLSK